MNSYTMKTMPDEIKPYERFEKYGAEALSDAELLAIIIRTGAKGVKSLELANVILGQHKEREGLLGIIHASLTELQKIKGIGRVKAIQLKAIAELSRRISKAAYEDRLDFSKPAAIAGYYMEDFRHMEKETLFMIMLDNKCRRIRESVVSVGTINESFCNPRELYREALLYDAVYICVIHNHPSGDPTPSKADITSTTRLVEAGRLIGISVIDHIIIGDNKYISLKEYGLL